MVCLSDELAAVHSMRVYALTNLPMLPGLEWLNIIGNVGLFNSNTNRPVSVVGNIVEIKCPSVGCVQTTFNNIDDLLMYNDLVSVWDQDLNTETNVYPDDYEYKVVDQNSALSVYYDILFEIMEDYVSTFMDSYITESSPVVSELRIYDIIKGKFTPEYNNMQLSDALITKSMNPSQVQLYSLAKYIESILSPIFGAIETFLNPSFFHTPVYDMKYDISTASILLNKWDVDKRVLEAIKAG